jgi:hypothetical protein
MSSRFSVIWYLREFLGNGSPVDVGTLLCWADLGDEPPSPVKADRFTGLEISVYTQSDV